MKFSGSEWILNSLKVPDMSPLGVDVADLLGQAWQGIYHIQREVMRVDWSNPLWIEINIHGELATYDSSRLTQLVVLSHDAALRMSIEGCGPRMMKLMFHRRKAWNGRARNRLYERHPSLELNARQIREWLAYERSIAP